MKKFFATIGLFILILLAFPFVLLPYLAGKHHNKPLSIEAQHLVSKAFIDIDVPWVDIHFHWVGMNTEDLFVNPKMKSFKNPMQYYRYLVYKRAIGITDEEKANEQYDDRVKSLLRQFPKPGRTYVLAFDKYYEPDGTVNLDETEFYVSNAIVEKLADAQPDLFAPIVSVNPYRPDALAQLSHWHEKGVRIIKWLPNAMGIDPEDDALLPFYEKVKALNMAILAHVGIELAVESAAHQSFGNPLKWQKALDLGTKVIFAHVGSLGQCTDTQQPDLPEVDCFDLAMRMLSEPRYKNNLFADISSTISTNRKSNILQTLLERTDLHARLINGSDYPIPAINLMVSTRLLAHRRLITQEEARLLTDIYKVNPLLFDFVLKRTLRSPETGKRFATSIFTVKNKIFDQNL